MVEGRERSDQNQLYALCCQSAQRVFQLPSVNESLLHVENIVIPCFINGVFFLGVNSAEKSQVKIDLVHISKINNKELKMLQSCTVGKIFS